MERTWSLLNHQATFPDQARAIRKNGWLSDLELENIRRMIEAESELVNESIEDVEEKKTERNIARASERN